MSQSFTNRVVLPDGSVVTRPADLPPRASAYLEALANSAHQDADRAEAAAQGVGAGAVAAAEAAAAAAAASQGGAADSALAAATSAANSSTSADAASSSATAADGSADAAAASATAAAGSATSAESQADAAAGSASAAATSADEAEAFRDQAQGSRTEAANSASVASDQAALASGYAADALASAGSAEDSADAAAASAASIEPTSLVKRDGSQGMTAELPLAGDATQALSAVPKQQLDAGLADKVDVGAISSFWYGVLPAADAASALAGLSSAWRIIGRTSANAAAAVDFTWSSDIKALRLTCFAIGITLSGALNIRFMTGGVPDAGASDYSFGIFQPNTSAGTTDNLQSLGVSSIALAAGVNSSNYLNGEVFIDPGDASRQANTRSFFVGTSASPFNFMRQAWGRRAADGRRNGIRLVGSSGVITGEFLLEGAV